MAKSLSADLRARVIAAVDGGLSRRAAAARFGVAAASAVRWVREWRETGAARARQQGGDRRSQRIEVYRDIILTAIESQVDITLVELTALLREKHGASFAASTMWRFLDRHAVTVKTYGPPRRQGINSRWHDGSASTYPVSRLKPWPRWISAQPSPHKNVGAEHHILNQVSRLPVRPVMPSSFHPSQTS